MPVDGGVFRRFVHLHERASSAIVFQSTTYALRCDWHFFSGRLDLQGDPVTAPELHLSLRVQKCAELSGRSGRTSRNPLRDGLGGVHPAVHRGLAGADAEYLPGCSFGEGLGDLPGNWAVNAQGSCGILAPVHRMRCGQHCIESRVGSFSVPRSRSCRAVLHQQTSGAIYSGVCNRDDHNIANLITDLTHFCDREGHNFRGIIRRAMRNWEAERRAEGVLNGEPGLTLEWQGRPVTFQGSDDSVLHARVKGMACCFAPETATGAHVTTIV